MAVDIGAVGGGIVAGGVVVEAINLFINKHKTKIIAGILRIKEAFDAIESIDEENKPLYDTLETACNDAVLALEDGRLTMKELGVLYKDAVAAEKAFKEAEEHSKGLGKILINVVKAVKEGSK